MSGRPSSLRSGCALTLAPSPSAVQLDVDWAQLPVLARLALNGVELGDTNIDGFSALQQLSSLELSAWADGGPHPEGPWQSKIARVLRASPAALCSVELQVLDLNGGNVSQFQPELAAAVGGLTQLRQLRCDDLGAACQLNQLQELRVLEKSWPHFNAVELVKLRALRGLTRLDLYPEPALDPLATDLKAGVEQVRRVWGPACSLLGTAF